MQQELLTSTLHFPTVRLGKPYNAAEEAPSGCTCPMQTGAPIHTPSTHSLAPFTEARTDSIFRFTNFYNTAPVSIKSENLFSYFKVKGTLLLSSKRFPLRFPFMPPSSLFLLEGRVLKRYAADKIVGFLNTDKIVGYLHLQIKVTLYILLCQIWSPTIVIKQLEQKSYLFVFLI